MKSMNNWYRQEHEHKFTLTLIRLEPAEESGSTPETYRECGHHFCPLRSDVSDGQKQKLLETPEGSLTSQIEGSAALQKSSPE